MAETRASESAVHCRRCGVPCALTEVVEHPSGHKGPVVEFYACQQEGCGRRAAVTFEPDGGLDAEQATWVEREVARRGAFFPADYGVGRGGRGW